MPLLDVGATRLRDPTKKNQDAGGMSCQYSLVTSSNIETHHIYIHRQKHIQMNTKAMRNPSPPPLSQCSESNRDKTVFEVGCFGSNRPLAPPRGRAVTGGLSDPPTLNSTGTTFRPLAGCVHHTPSLLSSFVRSVLC